MSIKQTYKALGDKDYSITLFADAFANGETTITELYAFEQPSNNGQALALFGGYAKAQFGMALDAIMNWVSVFTSEPQAVYNLMIEADSLSALSAGLASLEVELDAKSDENRAKRIASGVAHKTSITSIINQAKNLRDYGVVSGDNLSSLNEAITMLQSIYTESEANSRVLVNN